MGWIPAKPSTRINRSVASPFGLNKNAGKAGPPTRWLGGDAYQTNISEFDKGIEDSGIGKFQYILFDDCNMTGIEVAYELRNATHHIIGSPTEIMAYGMPYKLMWNELSKVNPNYRNICNTFINFYSNYTYNGSPYPYGTISVIDCSQVEGMVNIMKEINASSLSQPLWRVTFRVWMVTSLQYSMIWVITCVNLHRTSHCYWQNSTVNSINLYQKKDIQMTIIQHFGLMVSM